MLLSATMQDTKERRLQVFVLLASIIQLICPLFVRFDDTDSPVKATELAITPPGYAFGIWAVITTLAFAYGIYQILPHRRNKALHQKLSRGLILVYFLFFGWLIAADFEWLIVTITVFTAMLCVLAFLLDYVLKYKPILTRVEKAILWLQLGLYTGWSAVAVFLNVGSLLSYYGVDNTGITGLAWQLPLLAAAAISTIWFIRKFKGDIFFTLAVLWAFGGVMAGLIIKSGDIILKVVVGLSILSIILVTVLTNRKSLSLNR
jgi:hypothetical protein